MNLTNKLLKKIYFYYEERILPEISGLRGTYRIKRMLEKILQLGIPKIQNKPDNVYEKEWDNLIILDACRHDLYEKVNGETESRITLASSSAEYIRKNFSEGDFSDIVYVSGNPFFSESHFENLTGRKPSNVFHEVFHTYMTDWDEDQNTILPKPLMRDAQTAKKLFPNKRLVVHFMQPHHPFIGYQFEDAGAHPDKNRSRKIWKRTMKGEYDREEIYTAYKENLEYVMDEIDEFLEQLEGKTIITADHGNLIGENGLFGHGLKSKAKGLRKVPWDTV
jgi:hypothetical protein